MPYDRRETAVFESDPLAMRVASGLAKVGLALKHHAWRGAGRQRLTPTQGQILVLLSSGGMTISDLADRLAVAVATVTDAVETLVRKGLVRKDRGSSDGRSRVATLTAAGRREAARVAQWTDFLQDAVDSLSPRDQEDLLRVLVKLIRTLQERGQIPVSRMCVTCRFFRPYAHPGTDRPHHCGFVDAPFGDRHLRVDCPDHAVAPPRQQAEAWARFAGSPS